VFTAGIAPKLLPILRRGAFMDSLVDKGRFGTSCAASRFGWRSTPAPLIEAARYALRI
jgi:glucokinase